MYICLHILMMLNTASFKKQNNNKKYIMSWGGGSVTKVVRPLKKTFFMCVFPKGYHPFLSPESSFWKCHQDVAFVRWRENILPFLGVLVGHTIFWEGGVYFCGVRVRSLILSDTWISFTNSFILILSRFQLRLASCVFFIYFLLLAFAIRDLHGYFLIFPSVHPIVCTSF